MAEADVAGCDEGAMALPLIEVMSKDFDRCRSQLSESDASVYRLSGDVLGIPAVASIGASRFSESVHGTRRGSWAATTYSGLYLLCSLSLSSIVYMYSSLFQLDELPDTIRSRVTLRLVGER